MSDRDKEDGKMDKAKADHQAILATTHRQRKARTSLRGQLDRIDYNILMTLQAEGRITNRDLAGKINLSPSPCLERVKRLEKIGLIRGYRADIAIELLFEHIYCYVEITLKNQMREDFSRFEDYILGVPEVLDCCLISGNYDYLIKVIAIDLDHFHAIMDSLHIADIGIAKNFTYVAIKNVKQSNPCPISVLADSLP